MKSMFVKVALVAAVAVPMAVLRADDEKKVDEKKADDKKIEKRVEVKVLQLDGKDGGKPEVKIFRSDKAGGPVELKVLGLDGAAGNPTVRVFVDGAAVGEKAGEKLAYLGVAIDPVPDALAAHLPGLVSRDQGLLVTQVSGDSPAAKAGVKEHDILVSYDDQKLFSAEQLTKLVRGDKPGREVTLSVVRSGKLEKLKATLGEREASAGFLIFGGEGGKAPRLYKLDEPQIKAEIRKKIEDKAGTASEHRDQIRRLLKEHGLDEKAAPGAKTGVQTKSSFSSMRLQSLDGDRFKAEIEFKNEKGDSLKRSFEGTRDEIRKQIEADKDMPEAIRNQLMRSLDFGKSGKGAFHFNMPRGGFWIDTDWNDLFSNMPAFKFPDSKEVEQIIEQFSEKLDPETREKLKGAIRSIEQPKKNPTESDRPI